METNLLTFNKNKRTKPSSPTVSGHTEEDTETKNKQNKIATKPHKEHTIKKAKVMRSNSQATIEFNTLLESAKQIFTKNSSNIKIKFTQFKAIIENAPNCSKKQELCDSYKIEPNNLIKIIKLVNPAINRKAIKNQLTGYQ